MKWRANEMARKSNGAQMRWREDGMAGKWDGAHMDAALTGYCAKKSRKLH